MPERQQRQRCYNGKQDTTCSGKQCCKPSLTGTFIFEYMDKFKDPAIQGSNWLDAQMQTSMHQWVQAFIGLAPAHGSSAVHGPLARGDGPFAGPNTRARLSDPSCARPTLCSRAKGGP